jgi:hypothetical protein
MTVLYIPDCYDLDLHVLLLDPLLGLGGLQLVGQLSLCFLNKNKKKLETLFCVTLLEK